MSSVDHPVGLSYVNVLPPTACYFAILFGCAPLFTQVIIAEVCYQKGYDSDDCDDSEVSSAASLVAAANSICLYLPTILTTGPYGAIANKYGRKPVLLSGLIGVTILVSGYLYVAAFRTDYYFAITATASLLCGLSGGYSSFIMGIFSYTADTTAHDTSLRKKSYPVTEACIFIPKLFCPVLTGIWAASYGFILPLLTSVILAISGTAWVLFIPESLPLDSECRSIPLSLNPLSTLVNISYLFKHEPLTGRSPIPYISIAFSMAFACYVGFSQVFLLYAKHTFHWGPDMIGYFDGVDGGISAFSMLCLPAIIRKIMKKDYPMLSWIQVGFFFRTSYFLGLSFIRATLPAFLMLLALLPVGLVAPYSRTILSNSVPLRMQAEIFAGFSAIESIATLVSPLFTLGYSVTTAAGFPQAMFLLMAIVTTISFCIVTYVQCSEDLSRNLPDNVKSGEAKPESEANVKHSLDEACGHYRGSAVLSSDGGYSADLQVKKYRFDSSEGSDIRQRLLHSGDDGEEF